MSAAPELLTELPREERLRIAQQCLHDPVKFCKRFLPDLFSGPVPWLHRGILAILTGRVKFLEEYGETEKIITNFVVFEDPLDPSSPVVDTIFSRDETGLLRMRRKRNLLLMLPRGFSKTTLAGIAVPLYKILYQTTPFFVYVSHAGPHAQMQLDNVKRQLDSNERILAVFGEVKPALRDAEAWAKGNFETTTGMTMMARGKGGQVRGLNHKGQRPKEIIFDDLDDLQSVTSDTDRNKTITWAYSDLFQARSRYNKDAILIGLGTRLHTADLLTVVASDPQWSVVKFGARDLQGDLLWEANMDDVELEKERKSFLNAGRLPNFYLEFFNEVRSVGNLVIDIQKIITEPFPDDVKYSKTATYCDPAFSKSRTADYSVVATVTMTDKGILYVRDCWFNRGAGNAEIADEFFRQQHLYKSNVGGIENIAGQAALEDYLRECMFRKKQYFELLGVPNKVNKIQRISGALPARYHAGYLRHCRKFPELISQLDGFRMDDSHVHDDGPDAVCGAVCLLDRFAAMAAGSDLSEDSYEPLEKVFKGNWRRY